MAEYGVDFKFENNFEGTKFEYNEKSQKSRHKIENPNRIIIN